MFFVKSSEIDIPENTNPEGLGEILKEVLAHLKLDDPTMVLDADLHNGSDSPFLLHGESSLDLTEEINKWLRSNRRLTEPSPDLSLLPAP